MRSFGLRTNGSNEERRSIDFGVRRRLADLFNQNFKKFEDGATAEIRGAAPRVGA